MTIRTLLCVAGVLAALAPAARGENLQQLYRLTLAHNPVLQGREQFVEQAEAQESGARSRLRPQLSISSTGAWNSFHNEGLARDEYTTNRSSVQARQALFDLPAYRRLKAARSRTSQSQEERDAARLEVTLQLVQSYLAVLAASNDMAYINAEKASVASQLERLRRMQARQMAKITDVYETEAYHATLAATQLKAQSAHAVALEKLREVVGVRVADIPPGRCLSYPYTTDPLQAWLDQGLQRNPGLESLRRAMEAESRGASAARAEHWPRVSLFASETYSESGFDNRRSPPFDVASAGVQLDLPLYEGGRVSAAVREARARYEIARIQYDDRRGALEQEIREAYLNTVANHALIDATVQAVQAQEKTRDAQQRGYELGAATVVDVLDAERRLYKARSDQSRACEDFVISLVSLRLLADRLSEQDIGTISDWVGGSAAVAPAAALR